MALIIEPLDRRRHDRAAFNCGEDSLNRYLRQQASQDLKRQVATVFVLVDRSNSRVLAYYTLSAFTIDITMLETKQAKRLPRYPQLPATLLGRLAVDQHHKGQGFGELMLIDALAKAWSASAQIASLAVIAEALHPRAAQFYCKYGFQPFKKHPLKLYLPMQTIASLIQSQN